RIELGEIEAQLLKLAPVQQAVVIAREDGSGQKQLCAYIVAERQMTVSELRGELSRELPGYMIPSYFVQLEQMPLSANGKLDRKALPAPEGSVPTGTEYVAPRTAVEAQLVEIWQQVLGVGKVGIRDDFFEIGGHSLKVLQLLTQVHSVIGVNLPLHTVFNMPTIEEMAREISKHRFEEEHGNDESEIIRLNEHGPVNMFCFPPVSGYSIVYHEMAKQLENHCVVYGLEFIGDRFHGEELLTQYVESIINIQPKGPYILLGYSLGGNLAFEVAKAMEQRGYSVSDIVMLDSCRRTDKIERSLKEIDSEVEDALNEFSYQQHLFTPSIREKVKNKMYAYLTYKNELVNMGTVQANIHALIADGSVAGTAALGDTLLWKSSSMANYTEYDIVGNHDELLGTGFIEENVKVLRLIVNGIISKTLTSNP
ncbi:thioesterase domain-containing protein, partial [Paenibacillus elgii]